MITVMIMPTGTVTTTMITGTAITIMVTVIAIITTMTSVGLGQVHWTCHGLGVLPVHKHKGEGRRAPSKGCLSAETRQAR